MLRCCRLMSLMITILSICSVEAQQLALPQKMLSIMQQARYQHANWGLLAKDLETGELLINYQSDQFFLPASTTKLFSVAALLRAYGDDYRYQTPVFAWGSVRDGILRGNLILVAQGDLTMGGRQDRTDMIAFTPLDHIVANAVPGVTLTEQDPLNAFYDLAKQVRKAGIKQIEGDILIDDRLFQAAQKRDMALSPILINENLIDLVLNPTELGQMAELAWRPYVPGYTVINQVKTVATEDPLDIQIQADKEGQRIVVQGTLPIGQKDVVRTFAIKNPVHFARAAFMQALIDQGIVIHVKKNKSASLPSQQALLQKKPIAIWTSPPLSEYAKLILKVSHNAGADLIPLLLAALKGKRTFEEGMLEFGKFVTNEVGLPPTTFVFVDAAGGDENRLTPRAEVELLEYIHKWPANQFKNFYHALPILGVDGSLADFGKNTPAVGKIRAKPGTGMSLNLATNEFFLTTQTLAGYVEGKNGHLIAFMIAVNNGLLPTVEDVFPVFEDVSQLAALIYELSN